MAPVLSRPGPRRGVACGTVALAIFAASASAAGSPGYDTPRWLTGVPGRAVAEDEPRSASRTANARVVAPAAKTTWQPVARHVYSKVQAWNCDGSLSWLSNRGATPELVFIDTDTGKVRFQRRAPGTEIRWLPDDAGRMLFVADDTIGLWTPETDRVETLTRFPALAALAIGPWEGNLSHSGRELVVTGTRRRDGARISQLYDRVRQRVVSRHRHADPVEIDWISVSASGRYVVMNGALVEGGVDQTRVFDRRFRPVGKAWLEFGRPSHYDLTIDPTGDDVAVGVAKSGRYEGRVIARRLRDGVIRPLTENGYASHTSARNTRLPGWVFVTYPNAPDGWPGHAREILAVSLDGAPPRRVIRIDETDTRYEAQPQALPSPDGQHVIWAAIRAATDGEPGAIGTRIATTGLGRSEFERRDNSSSATRPTRCEP